jgi:hypothetical protein
VNQAHGQTPNEATKRQLPTRGDGKSQVEIDRKMRGCEEDFKKLDGLKADDPLRVHLATAAQMGLAQLGYGTYFTGGFDEHTRAAVRKYQERRGIKATGEFDCQTFLKFDEDTNAAKRVDLEFMLTGNGKGYISAWEEGYASVKGTWTITNDEAAYPFQVSNFQCDKSRKSCTEATGTVDGLALHVDIEFHEIERWDDYEIVTKPRDTQCTRYVVRFNRAQQQLTATRSTIRNTEGCEGVEKRELHLVLADGVDVVMNERVKSGKAAREAFLFRGKALTNMEKPR